MRYIYLVRAGADYKIGFSKHPEQRVKEIQTSCSEKVELIHKIPSKLSIRLHESVLHRMFAAKRKNGEWFALNEKDVLDFPEKCMKVESSIGVLIKDNHFMKKRYDNE